MEPHFFFKHWFTMFSSQVYEGRWASVSKATGRLLLLEVPLRAAWSYQAYKFGHGRRNPGRENYCCDIDFDAVDGHLASSVKADYFWAYLHMVDLIGEMLEMVMGWSERCPCHWVPKDFVGPKRHTPKQLQAHRAKKTSAVRACPLAGMRAPELAVGELRALLDTFWREGYAGLLQNPCVMRLPEQVRTWFWMSTLAHTDMYTSHLR